MSDNKTNLYKFLESQFTPRMLEKPEVQLMLSLLTRLYDQTIVETTEFTDLIDPDTCPDEFLPLLAKFVGYAYNSSLTPDAQRPIIKNYLTLLKRRGTLDSLKRSFVYLGNPEMALLGRQAIFTVSIDENYKYMFRHGRSKFCHKDVFFSPLAMATYTVATDSDLALNKDYIKNFHPAGMLVKFLRYAMYEFIEYNVVVNKTSRDILWDLMAVYEDIPALGGYNVALREMNSAIHSRPQAFCGMRYIITEFYDRIIDDVFYDETQCTNPFTIGLVAGP